MIVVDASVWVAWLLPGDIHHAGSRRWLATRLRAGRPLVMPAFALVEIAGAIARRTGQPALGRAAVAQVLRLDALAIYEEGFGLSRDASAVAAHQLMRGADAIYVALARRLGAPLVTWDLDQRLRAAGVVTTGTPDDEHFTDDEGTGLSEMDES